MDDSGANADLFEMPGERFGDSPGCCLHINFARAGKCADRGDVSEDSSHCELEIRFRQETANIVTANLPPAGKTI